MIPFTVPQLDAGALRGALHACFAGRARKDALVEALEARFAEFIGAREAVAVNSARAALTLLYRYIGCERGRVVASPYVCVPAIDAIRWAGGRPLFVDIDPRSYNLLFDERLEAAKDVRAVCLSYLYGLVDDPRPFIEWARRRGIFLIEDAAIALGARIRGSMAGSLGDAGVFSLQSSKIISGWRGAVVTTNDAKLGAYLRAARAAMRDPGPLYVGLNAALIGVRRGFSHPALYGASLYPLRRASLRPWGAALLKGFVGQDPSEAMSGESPDTMPACEHRRLSGVQAALALPSLRRVAEIVAERRAHARFLSANLATESRVILPADHPGLEHAFGRFPIRIAGVRKQEVSRRLSERGIEAGEYYPYTIPETRHFAAGCESLGPLPNAALAARETVLLPMHTRLREADLARIVSSVRAIAT